MALKLPNNKSSLRSVSILQSVDIRACHVALCYHATHTADRGHWAGVLGILDEAKLSAAPTCDRQLTKSSLSLHLGTVTDGVTNIKLKRHKKMLYKLGEDTLQHVVILAERVRNDGNKHNIFLGLSLTIKAFASSQLWMFPALFAHIVVLQIQILTKLQ